MGELSDETEQVHWGSVDARPTSLHGNGAAALGLVTLDWAKVTCGLCQSLRRTACHCWPESVPESLRAVAGHWADCPARSRPVVTSPLRFGPCVACKTPSAECKSPGCCETCADSCNTHSAISSLPADPKEASDG